MNASMLFMFSLLEICYSGSIGVRSKMPGQSLLSVQPQPLADRIANFQQAKYVEHYLHSHRQIRVYC